MSKSIFISCMHEDSHRISSITGWTEQNRFGDVAISHETENKRQQGKEAIKLHIKSKILGASCIFKRLISFDPNAINKILS